MKPTLINFKTLLNSLDVALYINNTTGKVTLLSKPKPRERDKDYNTWRKENFTQVKLKPNMPDSLLLDTVELQDLIETIE